MDIKIPHVMKAALDPGCFCAVSSCSSCFLSAFLTLLGFNGCNLKVNF